MIASMNVESVYEKEIDVGTNVTADDNGRESFFGSGTLNAKTDFTDDQTSPNNIRTAIDGWLHRLPSQK